MELDLRQQDASQAVSKVTKSDRTRLRCLLAVIEIVAERGLGDLSWESVAQRSQVSRPLVKKYFPSKSELILETAMIARHDFQLELVAELERQASPQTKFRTYVTKMLAWPRLYPEHAAFWISFYHYCCLDQQCRTKNLELVQMGHRRIASLLQNCQANSLSPAPTPEALELARVVQTYLTGAILSMATEDSGVQRVQSEKRAAAIIFNIVTKTGSFGVFKSGEVNS
jgi:AcrR family transcriptional regulator